MEAVAGVGLYLSFAEILGFRVHRRIGLDLVRDGINGGAVCGGVHVGEKVKRDIPS